MNDRTATTDFTRPDYADRYHLTLAASGEPAPVGDGSLADSSVDDTSLDDIATFVERLTRRQPRWLTAISMGIASPAAVAEQTQVALHGANALDPEALAEGRVGIGNWRIIERSNRHVIFHEDMRIMRYRITYRLEAPDLVSAETDVVQQSRWAGPLYWWLAEWGHRRFVPIMLRNAGGAGSTVAVVPRTTRLQAIGPTGQS